jgi:hypothetical protein
VITIADLIRRVDGVELPAPGWWSIAGPQPAGLRTVGFRRRTFAGIVSGGLTLADDPLDSTIDLLVSPSAATGPDSDLAIHATLASAHWDGTWRFRGSVESVVTAPIDVDVRYHGVFRRGGRATAWLRVRAGLPGGNGRPRLALDADVNADGPAADDQKSASGSARTTASASR